jgi:4-diphosphocytidyl-2-C-methyl-D-erythritol kinase
VSGPAALVRAQAKVNLFLHVLARERSGYHQIETLFARIDLADVVVVRTGAAGRSLDCAGDACPPEGLGPAEQNLAWRAACAYADATGWPPGFAIEITKHIPAGAGLGGGSADAGAVLRALNALTPNTPLRPDRLVEVAGALGSDVPFLSTTTPVALAWGRGERMLPLSGLSPRPVWLLVPPFAVHTADAYAWLAAERGTGFRVPARVLEPHLLSWEGLRDAANDFEPVVTRRHAEIISLLGALARHGASLARMSGSGSAVFGVMRRDDPDAAAALASVDARLIRTHVAERVEPVQVLD